MRLSTPFFSFITRHQHQPLRFIRTFSRHPLRCSNVSAPIVFAAALSTLPTTNPAIDQLTKKLDTLAPRFELDNGEIHVLTTTEEFYSTLRKKILSAQKRVFLSSLYIGKEETELVALPIRD
jgi:hypothetical protein